MTLAFDSAPPLFLIIRYTPLPPLFIWKMPAAAAIFLLRLSCFRRSFSYERNDDIIIYAPSAFAPIEKKRYDKMPPALLCRHFPFIYEDIIWRYYFTRYFAFFFLLLPIIFIIIIYIIIIFMLWYQKIFLWYLWGAEILCFSKDIDYYGFHDMHAAAIMPSCHAITLLFSHGDITLAFSRHDDDIIFARHIIIIIFTTREHFAASP